MIKVVILVHAGGASLWMWSHETQSCYKCDSISSPHQAISAACSYCVMMQLKGERKSISKSKRQLSVLSGHCQHWPKLASRHQVTAPQMYLRCILNVLKYIFISVYCLYILKLCLQECRKVEGAQGDFSVCNKNSGNRWRLKASLASLPLRFKYRTFQTVLLQEWPHYFHSNMLVSMKLHGWFSRTCLCRVSEAFEKKRPPQRSIFSLCMLSRLFPLISFQSLFSESSCRN